MSRLTFTFFKRNPTGGFELQFESQETTWERVVAQLAHEAEHTTATKDRLDAFSLARFKTRAAFPDEEIVWTFDKRTGIAYPKRTAANVVALTALLFDYDNEVAGRAVSPEQVSAAFADYAHLIYSSASHRAKRFDATGTRIESCPVGAEGALDRFRLVLPLAAPLPLEEFEDRREAMRLLSKVRRVAAAKESFEAERIMYLPCRPLPGQPQVFIVHPGPFFDWHTLALDPVFVRKARPAAAPVAGKIGGEGKLLPFQMDIEPALRILLDDPTLTLPFDQWTKVRCCWAQLHTEGSGDTMDVIRYSTPTKAGNTFAVSCKHTSHGERESGFKSAEFVQWCCAQIPEETLRTFVPAVARQTFSPIAPETPVQDALQQAFAAPERAKLILANMGAGKTTALVNRIIAVLNNPYLEEVVLLPTKQHIKDLVERLTEATGIRPRDFPAHYIEVVESTEQLAFDHQAYIARKAPRPGTRIILTHHQLVTRQGHQRTYFAVLKWIIEHRAGVSIDEVDAFCEQLVSQVPLGAMYRKFGRWDAPEERSDRIHITRCLAHAGAGNCAHCTFRKHTNRMKRNGGFHLYTVAPEHMVHKGNVYEDHTHIELPIGGAFDPGWVQHDNQLYFRLPQAPVAGAPQFLRSDREEDAHYIDPTDLEANVNDLLTAAWRPTVTMAMPTLAGAVIKREEILARFIREGKRAWEPEDELRFPYDPCEQYTLLLADRRPLEALSRHAASIRLTTGTLHSTWRELLTETIPALVIEEIPVPEVRKVDQIAVIGYAEVLEKAVFHFPADALQSQVLWFERKSERAERIGKQAADEKISQRILFIRNAWEQHSNFGDPNGKPLTMTYLRSALSRGANLPEYPIAVINGLPRKPMAVVLAAELAQIPEAQIEDALLITLQGAARTLRMTPEEERGEVPAARLYVVAGVDRAAFEAVVARLALSVKGTVESAYAEGWIGEETILEAVKHWDRTKTIAGTIPQGMDDLREQIQALAARGLDKGEIKRAINFNRLMKTWLQEEMNGVNAAINAAVKARKRSAHLREHAVRFKAEGFTKGKAKAKLGWSMANEADKALIEGFLAELYGPPGG